MPDTTTTQFSHVKPADTPWRNDGLRDFFQYKDLGIEQATAGRVIAQPLRANMAPEKSTGWHRHETRFHIVIMTKGWAKFVYGDKETLVEAGDCVHQRPGIVHYLFDYSPDMEYIEVVGPADFTSVDAQGPCAVPAPAAWVQAQGAQKKGQRPRWPGPLTSAPCPTRYRGTVAPLRARNRR